MNKTVLALATALVLTGGLANPAFAKHGNGDGHGNGNSHGDGNGNGQGNGHGHGNGNGHADHGYAGEPYSGHKYKKNGVRSDTHWDRSVVHDSDHDGIANHYDNVDNRWDKTRFRYDQRSVYWAVRPYSGPRYVEPSGYRYNRWVAGASLPPGYYGDSYYVDYRPYNLPPPPYGYRWNRVGNDVYLVQTNNGLISEVVYSLFH